MVKKVKLWENREKSSQSVSEYKPSDRVRMGAVVGVKYCSIYGVGGKVWSIVGNNFSPHFI